jgi:hypothetical protein
LRKVAIIGKGGTIALAPWDDEAWEIWGMPWLSCPRATRLFEMHSQACADTFEGQDRDDYWVPKSQQWFPGVPVYCDPSRLHVFPNAVEYPLEGCDEIGLWGIHMMGRDEFAWQRPSVTYLIGLAQGQGVKVTIPPGSPLFMSGYEAGRYGVSMAKRDIGIITGWNR